MGMTSIERYIGDRPWMQTVTGRVVPLINPQPSDVHWPDVCYALAHIARFSGHVSCYSVAQHTLHALPELEVKCKPYWLLHDAHEYALSDIPTPVSEALKRLGDLGAPGSGFAISGALRCLKNGLDYALLSSVGLEWPIPDEIAHVIHMTDMRMALTERRDLLGPSPMPWNQELEGLEPFSRIIAGRWSAYEAYRGLAQELREWLGVVVPSMSEIERHVESRLDWRDA